MIEPEWIHPSEVLAFRAQLVALFSGVEGEVDQDELETALSRPRYLYAYEPEQVSLASLAAAYAAGIATERPFPGGNIATAMLVSFAFAECNGRPVNSTQEEAILTFLQLAVKEYGERELAAWFQAHMGTA